MADLIRGKVARVLNSREVALNVGSNNGVEVGMCFDILDPKGEDIIDPDTGESLGFIDRPRVSVRVTIVQGKLSVASTYKTKSVNVGGLLPVFPQPFARSLMPAKWVTKYETLKTEEKTWEDLDEDASYVKVGDPVLQVLQAEEEQAEEEVEEEVEVSAN